MDSEENKLRRAEINKNGLKNFNSELMIVFKVIYLDFYIPLLCFGIGQCKTQTADCGPGVKCRLSVKCRLQTKSKTQAGVKCRPSINCSRGRV